MPTTIDSLPARTYTTPRTWSEILPNLWQGGTAWSDDLRLDSCELGESFTITLDDFDVVATMYAGAKPASMHVQEFRYAIYDSEIDFQDLDLDILHDLAKLVFRLWKKGNRVLIRCQGGWNRSGLLMALVLREEGFSSEEAIDLIVQRRGERALTNNDFVEYLLSLDN
jgi:hypothetical protein